MARSTLGWWRRAVGRLGVAGVLGGVGSAAAGGTLPRPMSETLVDPDRWLAARVVEDTAAGVWPQALPRIHRNTEGRSDTAILFIHGFGACRAEGELVVDQLADEWQANVFYMRLPGHGQDADAHAAATPAEYTRAVAEALHVTAALGDQVVVVGASTGGLLATWAAGAYPDRVDAAVLVSPFYAFAAGWVSPVVGNPVTYGLARLAVGGERYAGWPEGEENPSLPGYADHWLLHQRTRSVRQLERLRSGVVGEPDFAAGVSAPVLMVHYYKDDDTKDGVVSTEAIVDVFDRLNGGVPHEHSRRVPIAEGTHILTSAYVRADHTAVLAAMRAFLTDVVGPPPR